MAGTPYGHNNTTKGQAHWKGKQSKIKDGNLNQRVDLTPEQFDKLLEQKGVSVRVYRSAYCPKVKSVDSAEHEIDCDMCNGSGFIDLYPIQSLAFIQSQDLQSMANLEGQVDGNSVTVTFPIGVELQYFTLVELCDFTDIYYQRVMRDEYATTAIDVLSYKACVVNFLMDYNGVEYFQDKDFKLNLQGNIEWLAAGNRPADNLAYTVHYEAKVQFRATRAMHVNRFTQVQRGQKVEHIKLPEQWLMTKEFLVRREDQNGVEMKQGPYDNHTIVT